MLYHEPLNSRFLVLPFQCNKTVVLQLENHWLINALDAVTVTYMKTVVIENSLSSLKPL